MQGFDEFCDNDGVFLPGRQGVVRAVVGRPPRRDRRRQILWPRCGRPPDNDDNEDDDDDDNGDDNNDDAGVAVALAANFITGLISVVLGCFGTLILKATPPAALLVPIAGIGFAFLGIEQVSYSIAAPIVGYSTIMWVYLGWYSGVRVG